MKDINDEPTVERVKPSLNFVEQVQNQIELCREAFSTPRINLSQRVKALEFLLWFKLEEDKNYLKKIQLLNKELEEKTKDIGSGFLEERERKRYFRKIAEEKFKLIMYFLSKKKLIPMGDF